MPPKKKKTVAKKKVVKVPLVIASDDTLPALSNTQTAALITTVASSDVNSLARLVTHYDYAKSLNSVDINGSTLIHIATKRNDILTLEKLISYRCINLDCMELPVVGGYTALHHACLIGSLTAMQILLQNGANPNVKCNNMVGESPLQICCKLGNIEAARRLINAGASVEQKDNFGNNAAFWAYKYHQNTLIRELGLHQVRTATAEEFLALMVKKNPKFVLPPIKTKKLGKKTSGKKKKKG